MPMLTTRRACVRRSMTAGCVSSPSAVAALLIVLAAGAELASVLPFSRSESSKPRLDDILFTVSMARFDFLGKGKDVGFSLGPFPSALCNDQESETETNPTMSSSESFTRIPAADGRAFFSVRNRPTSGSV